MDLKRIGDLLLSEKNRLTSGNAGHLYDIILRSAHKTSLFLFGNGFQTLFEMIFIGPGFFTFSIRYPSGIVHNRFSSYPTQVFRRLPC